jgi:hypothetical protein
MGLKRGIEQAVEAAVTDLKTMSKGDQGQEGDRPGRDRRPRRDLMLHIVESTKPMGRLIADLEQAVARHRFGELGEQDLKTKMAEKGVPFAREVPDLRAL